LENLPQKKDQFWSESVQYTPAEFSQPFFDWEALQRGEQKVEYMAPPFVAELDYAAYGWKIPDSITKRANLDTRLQIRLAVAFRLRLKRATWRTISRLVVLTYLCSGLARDCSGKLIFTMRTDPKEKDLTVKSIERNVYKALPDKDVNRDEFFEGSITRTAG
jgi:hypothetical protein